LIDALAAELGRSGSCTGNESLPDDVVIRCRGQAS